MITDPLFYRLFETSPETLFLVLGESAESAKAMAQQYEYEAIEFKETAHRADGVFRPKEPGLPLYVLEVQFYYLDTVFADLLVKAYTYLKQHDPAQPFYGVVLFASRKLEPQELAPYKALIEAGVVRPFYLDEMPEVADAPLGLSILNLIGQPEQQAPAKARELVTRTKNEIGDDVLRADLIELIETVIIYKLPRLSRREIEAMLQVDDIRKTRVFQEAKEEGVKEGIEKGVKEGIEKGVKEGIEKGVKEGIEKGVKEGIEKGIKEGIEKGIEKGIKKEQRRSLQEKRRSVARLAAMKMSAEKIAEILELDIDLVRTELAKKKG